MKWQNIVFVTLIGVSVLAEKITSEKIRYSGYKVYRYVPKTEEDVKMLQELETLGVRFWEGPTPIGKINDVMFAPHQLTFVEGLEERGLVGVAYISDVQTLIDNEGVIGGFHRAMSWTNYSSLEEANAWLLDIAQSHSNIASVESIGKSYEGRDLNVIKISTGGTKPIVFIDSNIHAREWITSAVTTYLINQLLNGDDGQAVPIQSSLDDFDFYILPHLNPDGIAFTQSEDRLWRKSNTTSLIGCKGADPNRNWDFHWLDGGSSTNPCSDLYAGPSAFSEPETKALSEFLLDIKDRLAFYLSVHSYGHYILIPYGHEAVPRIPEYDEYMRIGQKAAEAIANQFGTIFEPGNVVDLLYVASAESFDWVKGVLNPYLSLGIELRDKGHFGFVLPPEEIIPSSIEFIDGLNAFLAEVKIGEAKPRKM